MLPDVVKLTTPESWQVSRPASDKSIGRRTQDTREGEKGKGLEADLKVRSP